MPARAGESEGGRPVYSIVPANRMDEEIAENLQGYRGDGPVRIGNAAAGQVQHDTYGSIILAAMPMFFDRRLPRPGDAGLFHLLERLGFVAERSETVAAAIRTGACPWPSN
jgi:GH15 family glucan-1,4-alpha-glucosidase